MLLRNLDLACTTRGGMLVNGSRGVVVALAHRDTSALHGWALPDGAELVQDEARLGGSGACPGPDRGCPGLSGCSGRGGGCPGGGGGCPGLSGCPALPVARFLNGRTVVLLPEAFYSEVPGLGTCMRWQVGGWVGTPHKLGPGR